MRITKILIGLGLVLLLASCGPFESLHPLYTEKDLVSDSTLAGAWVASGDNDTSLTVEESGPNRYKLILPDSGSQEPARFEGHLVRLDDFLFLDVVPEEPSARPGSYELRLLKSEREIRFEPHLLKLDDLLYSEIVPAGPQEGNDLDTYQLHLIQAHCFYRVSIDGDVLRLAYLDDDWLKNMIDQEKVKLENESVGESQSNYVVTASTKDLQDFVREHAEDEEAFSKDHTAEFARKKQ